MSCFQWFFSILRWFFCCKQITEDTNHDVENTHTSPHDSNSVTNIQTETPTSNHKIQVQPQDTDDNTQSWVETNIFKPLDQTLMTKPSSYVRLNVVTTDTPIQSGVSFLALCTNVEIHDRVFSTLIPKQYLESEGQFTLNEEVSELYCPVCKQSISEYNSVGIGFRACTVSIKYRNTDGEFDQFTLTVGEDEFAFAKFSQPGDVKYFYVRFNLQPTY